MLGSVIITLLSYYLSPWMFEKKKKKKRKKRKKDEKFNPEEDIPFRFDLSKATRANQQQKRIIDKINTLKERVI